MPRAAHPLADLFPLLEGAEFDELVADIKASGLNEPIVVFEDKILDGRNRERACLAAGVEPTYRPFMGDDPLAFVLSANLHRRHLTESQRGMVAARLATRRQGARTDLSPIGERLSQGQAAALLGVGKRTVERAKVVREQGGPELVAAVSAGNITVAGAVEKIRGRSLASGNAMSSYDERGLDAYWTPEVAVRALLQVEKLRGPIWEPACGAGAIANVLRAAGHTVVATDIEADAYGCPDARGGVDFLKQHSVPPGVETVLTNSPFSYADEFVRHALELCPRVIMLLRLGFLEGQRRADLWSRGLVRVHVFIDRLPRMHREGWDGVRDQSNAMAFCWFVWGRSHQGPATLSHIWARERGESRDDQAPGAVDDDIPEFLRRAPSNQGAA